MKKLALTIGTALAVSGFAYGQGTIDWIAPGTTLFTAFTNTVTSSFIDGGAAVQGGSQTTGAALASVGYEYELLYSTTPFNGSAIAQPSSVGALFGGTWQDVGLAMTNTSSSSIGKIQPVGGAQNIAATPAGMGAGGVGGGQTNYIMLVGWSQDLGTSWSVVSNELATGSYASVLGANLGFFGESVVGYTVANTGNPGVVEFISSGSDSNGQPIVGAGTQLNELVSAVPEPSTMALSALGGLSLLLFRRRK